MEHKTREAINKAKSILIEQSFLTGYQAIERLLDLLGADVLAAVVADLQHETRPPDVIVNLDRPDLRLCFGDHDHDLQIMHPIELWVLGPLEPPPPGTAVHQIDTGELVAFRPLRKEQEHGYTRGLTS